ncbi:hypothetical protein [uncultured Mediterranean phage uvMED]|nr:hypothetical protein [uncultured Mediterranean phage uvMED]
MSKSSTGANISAEDIIRMNPDLLGQVGQAPPQSIPEPMPEPATMTTDQAIANFYGSGDRITQPDMAYYDQFPLPGDTGRAPVTGSAQMTDIAAPQPMANSGAAGAMPAFQPMQTPAEVMAAMARLSRGGRGGRKNLMERRRAQEVVDRFEEDPASFAPPAPVNLAGMNISTPMPTTAFQPQMMAQAPSPMPSPIAAPMERPAVMPSRGPMVPIFDFDFEDMERGMRFGR